jgi:GDSL-like lipase/acylhydrolase family protein
VTWRSYVAMGDSFTEGLNDAYPDGTFRGWADLVAARLALDAGPDFGYANLAIRGRMLNAVVDEQFEPTLAMRPDLVSFAAGGNDALRRKIDPDALIDRIDSVVGQVRATGADVILFRFADISVHLLHMSPAGHRRVAVHVLNALGVGVDEEWLLVPPTPAPSPWLLARGDDLRWAGQHLAPWIKRQIVGGMVGATVTAKRPALAPIGTGPTAG